MKRKLILIFALMLTLGLLFVTPALAHDGVGGDELAAADVMWVFAIGIAATGGIGLYLSFSNGEFRHPEKAKYSMLEYALVDENGEEVDKYAETELQF